MLRFNVLIPFNIIAILAMLVVVYAAWGIAGVVTFAGIAALLAIGR